MLTSNKKRLYILFFLLLFLSSFKLIAEPKYPQLNISGEKEFMLTQGEINGNMDLAQNHSLYDSFPPNLINEDMKLEQKLQLLMTGKLSEDLEVEYNIEQNPDGLNDRSDIKVKYQQHELLFGRFDAEFKDSSFFSLNKSMDGFMARSKQDNYNVQFVTAAERSKTAKTHMYGNGNKEYSIGKTYIKASSVKVFVNNKEISNKEYKINAHDGKITFDKIMNATDFIEIFYEYSDPLQDLIPILVDTVAFTGLEANYSAETPPNKVPVVEDFQENIIVDKHTIRIIPSIDYKYVLRDDFKINLSVDKVKRSVKIDAITPFIIRKVWIQFSSKEKIPLKILKKPTKQEIKNREPLYLTNVYNIPEHTRPGTHNAVVYFKVNKKTHRYNVQYYIVPKHDLKKKQNLQELLDKENDIIERQIFYTKKNPLVLGSEQVKLNGILLKKDFDYYMNYLDGKIQIVSYELSASDNIALSYKYYKNDLTTEKILGNGTIGPYFLKNKPIIRKSELITLDREKLWRGIDYNIDYTTGKITFKSKIYPISNLRATYRYQKMTTEKTKKKRSEMYNLGVTYLQEEIKPGDAEKTESETQAGTSTTNIGLSMRVKVSTNNNQIILPVSKLPVKENDDSFELWINNVKLTTADYTINNYTGTINIASQFVLTETTDITVNYTYLESIETQWTYIVDNQSYIESQEDEYLPIVYGGISKVEIIYAESITNEKIELSTKNYKINYMPEEYGNKFRIDFRDGQEDQNVEDWGEWILTENTRIIVHYKYTPGEFAAASDFVHKVFGLRGKLNLGENFNIESEFAHSEKNMARGVLDGFFQGNGTGEDGKEYYLNGNKNIVKESETVMIDGQVINDNQYRINYRLGWIKFYNGRNPQPGQLITVTYKYYSEEAENLKDITEEGSAFKVKSTGKLGPWTLAGDFSDISQDFNPVGNITQSKGSSEYGGTAIYQPNKHFLFSSEMRQKVQHKKDSDEKEYDENATIQDYSLKFKPLNYGILKLSYYNKRSLDDLHFTSSTVNKIHQVDQETAQQGANYDFELFSYPSTFEITQGQESNYLSKSDKDTNWLHFKNTYTPFSQLKVITDYQSSFEKNENLAASNSDDTLINKLDNSITDIRITYKPFSELTTQTDYIYKRTLEKKQTTINVTSVNIHETYEKTFDWRYRPNWSYPAFRNLSFHGRLYLKETPVPYSGYAPDTEERNNFDTRGNPWSLFGFNYENKFSKNTESDKKHSWDSISNKFQINNFDFFSLVKLKQLNIYKQDSNNTNLTESSTSSNYTSTETDDFNISLESKPFSFFSTTYYFEDNLREEVNITDKADSNISENLITTKTTESPDHQQKWEFSWHPKPLKFPFTKISLGSVSAKSTIINKQDNTYETTVTNNGIPTHNNRIIETQSQDWQLNYSYNLLQNLSLSDTYTRSELFVKDSTNTSTANRNKDEFKWTNDIGANWTRPLPWINISKIYLGNYKEDIFRHTFENKLSELIKIDKNTLEVDYQPIDKVNLNWHLQYKNDQQFKSPSTNTVANRDKLETVSYNNRYEQDTITQKGTLSYKPFSQLTLSTGLEFMDIKWENLFISPSTKNTKHITSQKLIGGISYQPWPDMSLECSFEQIFLQDHDSKEEGDGNRIIIKAAYRPVAWKWESARGSIVFNYEREINTGMGLNELEQEYNKRDNFTLTATEIEKVDNFKESMNLNLDIEIPMNDTPVIDKIKITGTATLINQEDNKDSKNNYNMFLMNINGKIIF